MSAAGAHRLVPDPELDGVGALALSGVGEWRGGAALPVLGMRSGGLLELARVGRGLVWLLASTAPLQNAGLGRGADAELGLALAGPPDRPIAFLERYHGYGAASGFAAVPTRWWVAFALLGLAAVTLMVASGRRFGPPQATARPLPPARQEYVDSLATILARARPRQGAAEPLRAALNEAIAARAGLGAAPNAAELEAGALLLGLPAQTARRLAVPAANGEDALALARAYVTLTRESVG